MSAFFDSIIQLREASEKNKLIVFVGAGVSANSDLPTWNKLVEKFAIELKFKKSNHDESYHFTNDELLKIPQFMFEMDSAKYYQIINETLNIDVKTNPINNIILDILPSHIITTNYDKLFENSTNINLNQYKVVTNDSDLLIQANHHYIIKMHGDIDNVSEIVLKEDDYLNYSNQRILTETYIKSLLVNHTFLFVGYSLNDYNLKLIMNWIEYLSKKENVKDNRHKNFIFQSGTIEPYYKKYWENKNFTIIESENTPQNLVDKYSEESLTHKEGRKLYTFLNIIKDRNSDLDIEDLSNVIKERYKNFDTMNYIYPYDLLKVSGIPLNGLRIDYLIVDDNDIFLKWEKLLQDQKIKKYWEKSGIRKIFLRRLKKEININLNDIIQKEYDILEKIICFNYQKSEELIKNYDKNDMRKNYYNWLRDPYSEEVNNYYNTPFSVENSTWETILNKYNNFLYDKMRMPFELLQNESVRYTEMLSQSEKDSFRYLFTLIQEGKDFRKVEQISNLLVKIESTYENAPFFNADPFGDLIRMQNFTYEHFKFIKFNGILLDKFSETISFIEYYLKALVKTQSIIQNPTIDFGVEKQAAIENYYWNHLDIYLFITYGNYANLSKYSQKNNIKNIRISKEVDISENFINFSNSISHTLRYDNYQTVENFKNFTLLLTHTHLSESQKKKMIKPVLDLASNKKFLEFLKHSRETKYFITLIILIIHENMNINLIDLKLFLHNIPEEAYVERHILKLLWTIKKQNISFDQKGFDDLFNKEFENRQNKNEKLLLINNLFPLLSEEIIIDKLNFLDENHTSLDIELKIHLNQIDSVTPIIKDKVKSSYYEKIKDTIAENEAGLFSFPNSIETYISDCILLFLHDYFNDVLFLENFASHSDHLNFLLNPVEFDYSKVDLQHYMWGNLITEEKYLHHILLYGKNQITKTITDRINLGIATTKEQILYYRYLVEDAKLWSFK